ncbi:F-box protein At2g34280, partial [Brassica rapa]|uniref:F-box protein At2g34280 n=1 Tax=Brassica campestris TaxID=3711 RepID=UPI00142E8668
EKTWLQLECGIGSATTRCDRAHTRETSRGISAEIQVCVQEVDIHNRFPSFPVKAAEPSQAITRYRTVKFPFPNLLLCYGSCDGLVCLFCIDTPNVVVNPATRWHRSFPFSSLQRRIIDKGPPFGSNPIYELGFGKDKLSGTYKPVWLYNNSSKFGLDNVTTCEVFDFSTHSWRNLVPSSPYPILRFQKPVYFDGSLYWLTDCVEETKVLSFDLHAETFQVICKAPFADDAPRPSNVVLFILDDCLCASEKTWPTQVIWSLDSSSKTWKQMCSIDLTNTFPLFDRYGLMPLPVAILEKNKLYLHGRNYLEPLMLHDLNTKSFEVVSTPTTPGDCIYYFESLFSV